MAALERFPGLGHELRQVHVLAVGPERHQHGKLSRRIGTKHVAAEEGPVTHGHGRVAVEDHGMLHGADFAAISTKAMTHVASLRLLQAWLVPRCTRQSPVRSRTSPSSSTAQISPESTTQ